MVVPKDTQLRSGYLKPAQNASWRCMRYQQKITGLAVIISMSPILEAVLAHGHRRAYAGQLAGMQSKVNVVISRGRTQIKTRTGSWHRRPHRQRHRSMASPTHAGRDVLEQSQRPSAYSPEPFPAVTKAGNEFIHKHLHHDSSPSLCLITCPHQSPDRGLRQPASSQSRSHHAQTLHAPNNRSCLPSIAS